MKKTKALVITEKEFVKPFRFMMVKNSGDKVDVYWDSTRKIYSIRYKGKVIWKSENIELKDCKFKISRKAIDRIRKQKRKSICAVINGSFSANRSICFYKQFTFNPYKNYSFVGENGEELKESDRVLLLTRARKPECYYV